MSKDPVTYLKYILDQAAKAETYLKKYDETEDQVYQEALERVLQTLADATKFIPIEWKAEYKDVPWREIVDFRNFVVHGYFEIDELIVQDTVKEDLPVLVKAIEDMVKRYGE